MSMQDAVIVDVEQIFGQSRVRGRLELPKAHTRTYDGEVLLVGWALGTKLPVTAIELVRNGVFFERIGLDQIRPRLGRPAHQAVIRRMAYLAG